jgi:hypothetical protein
MERRWSVPIIAALSAVLAVVLVAPVLEPATGAIPMSGTYSACLVKATGAIKVINYPKVKCARGQRLIRWSQQGPAGAQGPAGPADWNAIGNKPAGFGDGIDDSGVTGITIRRVFGAGPQLAPDTGGSSTADCPDGGKLVGGGFFSGTDFATGQGLRVADSAPLDADTWSVFAWNPSTSAKTLQAMALCMTVQPAGAITTAKKGSLPAGVKKAIKKRSRR